MRIENKDVENTSYSINGMQHVIDFGIVAQGKRQTAKFNLKGDVLRQVTISVTCGCTTTNATYVDDETFYVEIDYSNLDSGTFGKIVHLNFFENGEQKSEQLKIKGLSK